MNQRCTENFDSKRKWIKMSLFPLKNGRAPPPPPQFRARTKSSTHSFENFNKCRRFWRSPFIFFSFIPVYGFLLMIYRNKLNRFWKRFSTGRRLISFSVLRTETWASATWGHSGIKERANSREEGHWGETAKTWPWRLSQSTRDTRATYTWNEHETSKEKEPITWAYE